MRWLLELPAFPPLLVVPSCAITILTLAAVLAVTLACVYASRLIALLSLQMDPAAFRVALLSFVSIPVVSILFTYCHIWLALWMTFFPIQFVGLGWQLPWTNVGFPIGWQGIVPWRGREMAQRACRLMTTHLVSVDEILARLDADDFARALGPTLDEMVVAAVDAAGAAAAPFVWARLPAAAKARLHAATLSLGSARVFPSTLFTGFTSIVGVGEVA